MAESSDLTAVPFATDSIGGLVGARSGKRVALVTGGARRVGKACAIELAGRGFDLAIHANTSIDDARWLADELAARRGVACEAYQAELTEDKAAIGLVQQVIERFGRLDALVNCAAIWPKKDLDETTFEDVRRCLEVNTVSVFALAKAAGLRMADQAEGGVIVNLGDAALAHDGQPYPGYAGYHPSKAAIPGMTRALAVEFAARNPRVRVNAVLPGPVLCDTLPREPEESAERRRHTRAQSLSATLEGDADASDAGCGRAEHVAHAVAFLLDNPFANGVCLPIDGGGRLA